MRLSKNTVYSHLVSPMKKLGQHYLLDEIILEQIAMLVDAKNKIAIEIGPGMGTLSRAVLEHQTPKQLVLVEKDRRFAPHLDMLKELHSNVKVMWMDAKTELHQLPERAKLEYDQEDVVFFGNLPFNVATPIFTNLSMALGSTASSSNSTLSNLLRKSRSLSLIFMFQKEVARIAAAPGDSERCALSVKSQHLFDIRHCIDVYRSDFYPSPKVDASVLYFSRKLTISTLEYARFCQIVDFVFQEPRKMIRRFVSSNHDIESNLDLSKRPTELNNQQIVELAEILDKCNI